jgi:hypothetical protein
MAEDEERLASDHAHLKIRYRQAACKFWQCPAQDLPLPYRWDKDRDRRVLEAVLVSLIEEKKASHKGSVDRLALFPRVVVDKSTAIDEFENWYKGDIIPGEGLPIDVAADLQRRNAEIAVPLAEFKFSNRQIVFDDLQMLRSAALDRYPEGVAFVRVSLPGYSRDGKIALVAVRDILAEHPTGRVLALLMTGGTWRVSGSDYLAGE